MKMHFLKPNRWLVGVVILMVTLLFGGLFLWGNLKQRPLTIPLARIKPSREYQRIVDESLASNLNYPEKVLNDLIVSEIKPGDLWEVTENQSHLYYSDIRGHLGYRQELPIDNRSLQFFHADKSGRIVGEFGDVTLKYVGEISATSRLGKEAKEVPFAWFDAQRKPIPDDSVAKHSMLLEKTSSSMKPPNFGSSIRLGLQVESSTELHFLKWRAFETLTKQEIMTEKSIHEVEGNGLVWIDGHWITHLPTSKWIVVDAASGTSDWIDFDPTGALLQKNMHFPLTYLGMISGDVEINNSFPTLPFQYARDLLHKITRDEFKERRFSLLFFKPPNGYEQYLQVELENQAGELIPILNRYEQAGMLLFTFEGMPDDIRFGRLSATKQHYRFIFEIQSPSNVPAENGEVSDLLDVQIPYARFNDGYQMLRYLSFSMQIKIQGHMGNPSRIGNRQYENVTLRQIWEDYLDYYPPGFRHVWNEGMSGIIMKDHILLRRVLQVFE